MSETAVCGWFAHRWADARGPAEDDAEHLFEFGDGGFGGADLDGGHAHRLRGLQVDAQVVEKHALARLDADEFAGDLVEARLGLAAAHLARLDDVVEHHHDVAHLHALLATDDVVGETGGAIPGTDHPIEGHHHLGPDLARQQPENISTGDPVAERFGFVREQSIELVGPDVVSLEQRPRVGVGIGRVHAANEVGRKAIRGFVSVERFERTRQDHAAEIPEYCSDHGRRAYDGGAAADVIDPVQPGCHLARLPSTTRKEKQ